MNLPVTTDKKMSFWDKPEGLIGMIGALGAAAGLGYFMYWIVPIILTTFLGLLGILITGGLLVALSALIFTPNPLRSAICLRYQVWSRNMYKLVIDTDPIAVLRLVIKKAEDRLAEFVSLMSIVDGAARSVQESMFKYKKDMDKFSSEADLHKQSDSADEEQRSLVKYGKASAYYEEMSKLNEDMDSMRGVLKEARKAAMQIIEDSKYEIDNEETRLKAITATNKAWKKFTSIFSTSADENYLREEAMRSVADQANARLGEIDTMMITVKEVCSSVNTGNQIAAQQARQKLAALKKTAQPKVALPASKFPDMASLTNINLNSLNKAPVTQRKA